MLLAAVTDRGAGRRQGASSGVIADRATADSGGSELATARGRGGGARGRGAGGRRVTGWGEREAKREERGKKQIKNEYKNK